MSSRSMQVVELKWIVLEPHRNSKKVKEYQIAREGLRVRRNPLLFIQDKAPSKVESHTRGILRSTNRMELTTGIRVSAKSKSLSI